MNTQGLLALAQLILPSEILSNFEVVRVEEVSSLIRIYLDESVRAEYKENPKIESKGVCLVSLKGRNLYIRYYNIIRCMEWISVLYGSYMISL